MTSLTDTVNFSWILVAWKSLSPYLAPIKYCTYQIQSVDTNNNRSSLPWSLPFLKGPTLKKKVFNPCPSFKRPPSPSYLPSHHLTINQITINDNTKWQAGPYVRRRGITTGESIFEGHSPEWRVLSKRSFEHCNDSSKMFKEHVNFRITKQLWEK